MQVEQLVWKEGKGWNQQGALKDATLAIYFCGKSSLTEERFKELQGFYPQADLIGCSTGGEIYGPDVIDDSIVVAALKLESTPIKTALESINDNSQSFDVGRKLALELNKPNLSYVFVLSDGTSVNGTELVRGFYDVLDSKVIVTGGLAGDGANFQSTLVGLNSIPQEKTIAAIGFYGDSLRIGYGSVGGWGAFGPERLITKSENNILYELDGQPALDLYKKYLGEEAENLPGSALLFPLSIRPDRESDHDIVRTIVGIDEEKKAMIFAGDIPQGYIARLMKGDFNNLVDGAGKAASIALSGAEGSSVALLVSCIGRKLLMGQYISDETDAVSEAFNSKIPTIGFYSYGEICHQQFTGKCSLHNQTMTVTVLHEAS